MKLISLSVSFFLMAANSAIVTASVAAAGTKAVITQLEKSVIAGEGVNVNALASVVSKGTPLTATYTWDFGDRCGQYNTLAGWSAGHIYDSAGTYTITLTLTDSAGNASTAASQIAVKADTRPVIYVDSVAGVDANSGASPALAIKTVDQAYTLLGNKSSIKIALKCGGVFPVTYTFNITAKDIAIVSYGSGASPVLMWKGPAGNSATLYMTKTAANITIQGVTFDSPNAVTTGQANLVNDTAMFAQGTNIVVRDNTFLNVDDAVDGSMQPTGTIVMNNSAPLLKGLREYFCWVDGNNWTIVGNTVVNTTRAHCVRVNAADVTGVLIANNNLTKQYPADDPGEQYKTTIDVRIGSYVYVVNNILSDSTVAISPSPGQTVDQTANWIVFDGNTINNAQLVIDEVGHHVMVRNNVLNITATGQIAITPSGTTVPGALITDITISHNTGINTGQDGEFINVMTEPAPGSITIDHNVYCAANIRFGYGWDSAVWINAPDMKGFAAITGNIWPMPNKVQTPNVVNWYKPQGWLTPQQWGSLPGVSDEQNSNTALPSGTFQLTVGGATAGAVQAAKVAP